MWTGLSVCLCAVAFLHICASVIHVCTACVPVPMQQAIPNSKLILQHASQSDMWIAQHWHVTFLSSSTGAQQSIAQDNKHQFACQAGNCTTSSQVGLSNMPFVCRHQQRTASSFSYSTLSWRRLMVWPGVRWRCMIVQSDLSLTRTDTMCTIYI